MSVDADATGDDERGGDIQLDGSSEDCEGDIELEGIEEDASDGDGLDEDADDFDFDD